MTVPETTDIQLTKRADELKPGDRIVAAYFGEPATVDRVHRYSIFPEQTGIGSVMVVHIFADGYPGAHYCRADREIPVEAVADPTGLDFSREPDATEAGTVADGIEGGPVVGRAAQAQHPDDCGWMTPSGPCHLLRDHPLFPLGPREDSGHISKASAEANRARIAARENEAVIVVDHGPVKPPYGSPERAAYDAAARNGGE